MKWPVVDARSGRRCRPARATTGSVCRRRPRSAAAQALQVGEPRSGAAAAARDVRSSVVDDVVGPAGEAVQRVDGGAPGRGQQPGGEEVRPAVAGVEPAASRVGGAQRRFGGCRRRPVRGRSWRGFRPSGRRPCRVRTGRGGRACGAAPVIRAAASLPEMSTVGRRRPGWCRSPRARRCPCRARRLRGRNGPVWAKVWAAENGVPAACPCAGPVGGGDQALLLDGVAEARSGRGAPARRGAVAVARRRASLPVAAAPADVGVGAGREDVVDVAAGRGERGSVAVGRVISSDGSLISRPVAVSSSKVRRQARAEGEGVVGQSGPRAVGAGVQDDGRRRVPQRAAGGAGRGRAAGRRRAGRR